MRRELLFLLALALLAAIPGAADQARPASLNVTDFGAQGDGKSDDTAAFQKALDECGALGGTVSVPSGKYLIKTHLNVPASVTLEGTWRAPVTVNNYHDPKDSNGGPELLGSVLLAVEGAGNADGTAFITLNTNATLKGLTIFHPDQTKTNPPLAYPWTVASAGADNPSIVDVLMVNPYQAVDFGTRTSGRHYIRNLYAQPLRKGLFVDLCLDVGRLENIHFWPFWTAADADSPIGKFTEEQGEGFIFGRSDWEYVTNCFALGYHIGMRFVRSHQSGVFDGGGNYLLTQSGADCCDIAVLVDETQGHSGISFSNSQIYGDIIVKPTNQGMVRFTGCGLFGSLFVKNGVALADIAGRGRVSFDNCHFYAIHRDIDAPNMIRVRAGRVSITGSVFINNGDAAYCRTPIVLEPTVQAAIITENEFYGKTEIVNHATGRTMIKDNLFETDANPFPNGEPPKEPGSHD